MILSYSFSVFVQFGFKLSQITASNYHSADFLSEMADTNDGNTRVTGAALGHWCLSLFCLQGFLFTYKEN